MSDFRLGSMIVEDTGSGVPVVMIHGLGGDSNTFQTLMEPLGNYRVVRPDLPGAGRSPLRPGLPGLKGLASAVTDCLRAMGVDRAYLVGHSMGTLLCQHMAVTAPERILGMTLFGPIFVPPPPAKLALRQRAAEVETNGMAETADAVASGSISDSSHSKNPVVRAFVRESLMRQDPRGYAAHCRALSEAQAAEHDRIGCRVHLVTGELDPVAPPSMAHALKKNISGARLDILPGIAHWPMVEAPVEASEILQSDLLEIAAIAA